MKKNISKYLDKLSKSKEVFVVVQTSKDASVVFMPIKEYTSLIETCHLLSTPANRQRLRKSIAQLKTR